MINSFHSNVVSARLGCAAVDLVLASNRIGWETGQIIRYEWKRLLAGLGEGVQFYRQNQQHVYDTLMRMLHRVWQHLQKRLAQLWLLAHNQAVSTLTNHLPVGYFRPALIVRLQESKNDPELVQLAESFGWIAANEDQHDSDEYVRLSAGDIEIAQAPEAGCGEAAGRYFSGDIPVLEAGRQPKLTRRQERILVGKKLFPKPTKKQVLEILSHVMPLHDWASHVGEPGLHRKTTREIANTVASGLAQGRTIKQVAVDLRPLFNGSKSRAFEAARNLGSYVGNERTIAACESLGRDVVVGYTVFSLGGESARPDHALRSGTHYYWEPKPGQWGMNLCPVPPYDRGGPHEDGGPGLKKFCLLPGNKMQGRFSTAMRSHYSGEAVEIILSPGLSIRVTANHPILTPAGFVAADSVKEGGYLACYESGVNRLPDHEQDNPVPIEQIFDTFLKSGALVSTTGVVAMDFHGDEIFCNGNVNVVRAERELWLDFDAGFTQGSCDYLFIGRNLGLIGVSGQGTFSQFVYRPSSTLNGFVCGSDLPLSSIFVCDPTPFGCFGLGLVPKCDANFDELFPQGGSGYIEFFSKLIERFPSQVAVADHMDVGDEPLAAVPNRNAQFVEMASQGVILDPHFTAENSQVLAGQIAFNKIVHIKRFHYEGPVYDLETDTGYMIANSGTGNNGIFVSNCRCYTAPLFAKLHKAGKESSYFVNKANQIVPDPAHYSDWFKQASIQQREAAVGVRRYAQAQTTLGREPDWADFLDADTGALLTVEKIRTETLSQRTKRLAAVQAIIVKNKMQQARELQYI